ncbi:MAG: hypothetical protein AAF570_04715, partial [Bacteroidota bacterium]
DLLEEIVATGDIFFPTRFLNNTFAWHHSPEAVEMVETFLKARTDFPEKLKRKILQSTDGMMRMRKIEEKY